MKRRLYYYGEDVLSKSFLILPKELVFTESLAKMSAKSKILYCVLRERLILSARNNWKDENGRIYLIYSIEKMAQDLFYSRATIMRMMDELENMGLIERRKQGLGKPNLVYLCNSETIAELLSGADIEIEEWGQRDIEHQLTCQICNPEHTVIEDVTETMEIQEESAVSDVTCQICNPEESRIEQQEQIESEDRATDQQYQNWQSQNQNDPMTCQICNFQKYQDCNSNNTEYKKNNRYKHLSIMYTVNHSRVQDRWMDRDCVEAFFRKKWEYDVLLQDGADADLLSVLLAVAVDTCSRKSTTIHRFGRREYTTAELRTQFSKLTMSHIQYVLYSLGQTTTRIHNIRAYLLTSLYNAPDTMTFYYSRKVYEDLGYQSVSNLRNHDQSDSFRISEHALFSRGAIREQYAWR